MTTIPMRSLSKHTTRTLIAQYNEAISTNKGRFTNHSPRQRRIDFIVDLISERADSGCPDALTWFSETK